MNRGAIFVCRERSSERAGEARGETRTEGGVESRGKVSRLNQQLWFLSIHRRSSSTNPTGLGEGGTPDLAGQQSLIFLIDQGLFKVRSFPVYYSAGFIWICPPPPKRRHWRYLNLRTSLVSSPRLRPRMTRAGGPRGGRCSPALGSAPPVQSPAAPQTPSCDHSSGMKSRVKAPAPPSRRAHPGEQAELQEQGSDPPSRNQTYLNSKSPWLQQVSQSFARKQIKLCPSAVFEQHVSTWPTKA